MQYTAMLHGCKKGLFSDDFFKSFLSEAVLTSTHNLCFRAKIRKDVYPCKPHFYYIKVGCKGVFVTRTCFRDEKHFRLPPSVVCFMSFNAINGNT